MKVVELIEKLESYRDRGSELDVVVMTDDMSWGFTSSVSIESLRLGVEFESGKLFVVLGESVWKSPMKKNVVR